MSAVVQNYGVQGTSVRLSSDGNTLVIFSASSLEVSSQTVLLPAYVLTRAQNTWIQQSVFYFPNTPISSGGKGGDGLSHNFGIALSSLGDVLVIGQTPPIPTEFYSSLFFYN